MKQHASNAVSNTFPGAFGQGSRQIMKKGVLNFSARPFLSLFQYLFQWFKMTEIPLAVI